MDSGQGSAQTKQAKKSKKWPKVLLAVVLVASLVGNAWLLLSKPEKAGSRCDNQMIEKYNVYLRESSITDEKNKAFLKEFTEKDSEGKDPNCQLIVYSLALSLLDVETAKKAYQYLEELDKKEIYPSLKIQTIQDLEGMKVKLDNNFKFGGRG